MEETSGERRKKATTGRVRRQKREREAEGKIKSREMEIVGKVDEECTQNEAAEESFALLRRRITNRGKTLLKMIAQDGESTRID